MSGKLGLADNSAESIAIGQEIGRKAFADLARSGQSEEEIRSWLFGFLAGFVEPSARAELECVERGPSTNASPTTAASEVAFTARVLDSQTFMLQGQRELCALALNVEGMELRYQPGDELALLPSNSPETVREILRALRINPQTRIQSKNGLAPIWQVLLERVQLEQVSAATFAVLARFASTRDETDSLAALAAAKESRHRPLLTLLRRFPRIRPPIDDLVASLNPMLPTLVPIASVGGNSPRLEVLARKDSNPSYGSIDANLLARFKPGEWLTFNIRTQGALQSRFEPLNPVLFVCDGMGAAIVRTHVAQRNLDSHRGRNWILGIDCWSSTAPFADDATAWRESGHCRAVDCVPSDPVLFENAFRAVEETLWRWIVDKSVMFLALTELELQQLFLTQLRRLIATRGHLDDTSAKERLLALEAEGRLVYWHHG